MQKLLIVVRPFGRYAKGDAIRDTAEIDRVLCSEHANHLVSVAAVPIAPPHETAED